MKNVSMRELGTVEGGLWWVDLVITAVILYDAAEDYLAKKFSIQG